MNTLLLHAERLRRHHQSALRTYDPVGLVELSHSLRIWADLKLAIDTVAPDLAKSTAFRSSSPSRVVARAAAKQTEFVLAYFPGKVLTSAVDGVAISLPNRGSEQLKAESSARWNFADTGVEVARYCYFAPGLAGIPQAQLDQQSVSRLTFSQWLGAEVVRIGYSDSDGVSHRSTLTRENLIRRLANSHDGSHPSLAMSGATENRLDAPVDALFRHSCCMLPLPYFILLKIAQDLLGVLRKRLPQGGTPTAA